MTDQKGLIITVKSSHSSISQNCKEQAGSVLAPNVDRFGQMIPLCGEVPDHMYAKYARRPISESLWLKYWGVFSVFVHIMIYII